MSKIFTKNGFRGFTLIELLVVIAIIGLLSTVIAAPITQARKKGRDGKKVADLHQIQGSLQQYADDHLGNYPVLLDNMVPIYLAILPPFATTTSAAKDKYMYTVYTTSDSRQISFHLGAKLEAPSLALSDDRDCFGVGVIVSGVNYCTDVAASPVALFTTGSTTAFTTNLRAGDASDPSTPGMSDKSSLFADASDDALIFAAMKNDDFFDFGGGNDQGNTACTASLTASSTACIYDISN